MEACQDLGSMMGASIEKDTEPSEASRSGRRQEGRKEQKKATQPYSAQKVGPVQRDKWVDLQHPFMPPRHPDWADALKKGRKPLTPGIMGSGYLLPEPAIFAFVQSPESRKRFFANWLLLCPLWFGHVLADPSMVAPSPKIWQGFLNSKPSANASASSSMARTTTVQSGVASFFGRLLPELGNASTWAGDNTVTFQNQVIAISMLANPPLEVAQPILWELSELSFRFELLALNKNLVPQVWQDAPLEREDLHNRIFGWVVTSVALDAPLSTQNVGLSHNDMRHASFLTSVNNFHLLMSAWPTMPSFLLELLEAAMSDGNLRVRVLKVCRFYVNTFVQRTGRPPVLPCLLPQSVGTWA
ncbi:hypothetical protein BDN67DRAFT_1016547 [Paxillus ammoniavirescens]|nr:hypothetical protein BDN67DRAFT_1016547 [Paxillus ammoniavirescens]